MRNGRDGDEMLRRRNTRGPSRRVRGSASLSHAGTSNPAVWTGSLSERAGYRRRLRHGTLYRFIISRIHLLSTGDESVNMTVKLQIIGKASHADGYLHSILYISYISLCMSVLIDEMYVCIHTYIYTLFHQI